MAAHRTITWTTYYARQREDEGVIQTLFVSNLGTLADRSRTHLSGNEANFTDTITGGSFGNTILIPGPAGHMQLLHHGFSCLLTGTECSIIFAQGNHSDSSYFKILDREIAVEEIQSIVTHHTTAQQTNCPTLLASMIATTTEEEFANLPAAGNGILQGRPNHILINGDLLLMENCTPSFKSSSFAMKIIDFVRIIHHNEGDIRKCYIVR